jgi:hypothetical protein
MASCELRIDASSGTSIGRLPASCCGSRRWPSVGPAGTRDGDRIHADPPNLAGAVPVPAPQHPTVQVLRRPVESTQSTWFAYGRRLTTSGLVASTGTVGHALDNAVAESFFATLECELLDPCRLRAAARPTAPAA